MKRIVLVIMVCVLLSGCGKKQEASSDTGYKAISCSDITSDMVLVDVRTKEEYDEGHIEGSINVPLDSINEDEMTSFDKDKKIVLYCRSAARSSEAAKLLVSMGFINVYDLGAMSNCN